LNSEGKGIYLDPYQGSVIHKYFKNNLNMDPNMSRKLKNGANVFTTGNCIYLNPL